MARRQKLLIMGDVVTSKAELSVICFKSVKVCIAVCLIQEMDGCSKTTIVVFRG